MFKQVMLIFLRLSDIDIIYYHIITNIRLDL